MSGTNSSLNAKLAEKEDIELPNPEARVDDRPKFVSAWDALRPSFDERYDVEFPRVKWVSRDVDFD
jgi:hypothetical protein